MEDLLKNLLNALEYSPNNKPLLLQIANIYFENFEYENSEKYLIKLINIEDNDFYKLKLATCYYKLEKYNLAIVILDELIDKEPNNIEYLELSCNCLIKLENHSEALSTYKDILELNPQYSNDFFESIFKVTSNTIDKDFIDDDALSFIKKSDIAFKDVGGMQRVKDEIDLKIIKPLLHTDLYKAYGKKIGGGILLYGPPGCGKTHIAKATAGEINANFINVGINEILDMWLGNSEKNLHQIFETARKHKPCVIFIDEIDALGANRNDINKTTGRTVINQFLAELDGINSDNDGILVLGATNAPWYIDPAFRRPGRFDRVIFVSPPDENAREAIYDIHLKNKPTSNINIKSLAKKSKEFSGADIKASIDIAIEKKLTESFKDGIPKPLETKNILKAITKHKPTTKEWFNSARNYALYANNAGLYDDVLKYLNIKQ